MKKIGVLAIALFVAIAIWGGLFSNPAESQQTDFAISRLESELNRLESRINQLESRIGQNRPSPRSPNIPSTPARRLTPQQRDQMFDRLATLVIELRQDVNQLQQRVSKLESR